MAQILADNLQAQNNITHLSVIQRQHTHTGKLTTITFEK